MILFVTDTHRSCQVIISFVSVLGVLGGLVVFLVITYIILCNSELMKQRKKMKKDEKTPPVVRLK